MVSSRRPFGLYRTHESTLIESGTYNGDGISDALDCGFTKVLSYEVAPGYYEMSCKRFATDGRVTILNKPSQKLYEDIKDIDEPMMFWLDAHYSDPMSSFYKSLCPILEELEAIKKHHIKTHVILVDDVRLFGTREFGMITFDDVRQAILEINPAYTFELADGYVQKDILVARVSHLPKNTSASL